MSSYAITLTVQTDLPDPDPVWDPLSLPLRQLRRCDELGDALREIDGVHAVTAEASHNRTAAATSISAHVITLTVQTDVPDEDPDGDPAHQTLSWRQLRRCDELGDVLRDIEGVYAVTADASPDSID